MRKALACALLLATLATAAWASHLGDADLDGLETALGAPAQQLDLDQKALLSLLEMGGATSPELRELLASVDRVRARFYTVDEWRRDEIVERVAGVAGELDGDGWDTLVQVKDGNDRVHILLRMDRGRVFGVVAFFVGAEQAGFFHLKGDVDPAVAMSALVHGHKSIEQLAPLAHGQ